METTDSEESAMAEAARLDREAERTYQAEQNLLRPGGTNSIHPKSPRDPNRCLVAFRLAAQRVAFR
jgi:hypothetical protein